VTRVRHGLWTAAMVMASGALGAVPAAAQAPQAAASDSASLLAVAAVRARETATRLEGRLAARPSARNPAAAPYAAGLALLGRNQLDSAVVPLRAAVTASPDNARYHGDLGYALAASAHWPEAEDEYRAAVRLQQSNAWYYVGLGAVQVAQEHWAPAAASFTLAVATDSAVIIRQMVDPVGDAYEHSGNAPALEEWSRMAIARFPDEPTPLLRLARAAYLRRDTTTGFPAIRRYRTLRPNDDVGAMLYAEYELSAAQYDSAVALAIEAAADTTMLHLASIVLYNAGGHLLQAAQFDRAAQALQRGRAWAAPSELPQYDLYLGLAKFKVLQAFYADVSQHPDCRKAHPADSMLTEVTGLLTSGAAADSAFANNVLRSGIPQYRTAINNFVTQCRR